MTQRAQGEQAHENHEQHGTRHSLMMLVCCLLPMVAIFVLIAIFPGSPYLGFLAVAICPLSMVLMHLPDLLSKKKKKSASCH